MIDFDSVLSAALQLSDDDRVRLIELLGEMMPPRGESPLSDEWLREIERRSAELDAGKVKTIPWAQVRDEALARIGRGKIN